MKKKKENKVKKVRERKFLKKIKATWEAFKAFASKGSIIDLAVGVIIGGAFNAVVNTLVKILMSICTWGVPGGLSGLVTVLPAANAAQAGVETIGQTFSSDPDVVTEMVERYAAIYNLEGSLTTARSELLSKYTLHGNFYYYNGSALIDWGSFINAIISFLVIAITLFTIVRIFSYLQQKRLLLAEKAKEEYYKKHPEERPVVSEPEPPKPTQEELLANILVELKRANGTLVEEGTQENGASKDPV